MSSILTVSRVVGKQLRDFVSLIEPVTYQIQPSRNRYNPVYVPKPGINGKSYRRQVHYKDEYTVEPLQTTHLAGRDPLTGRAVTSRLGGGIKHKFHWIKWDRDGPTDLNEKPKEERVLDILTDGCRTSFVALVGSGKELKYILATANMQPGDIIKTHKGIPRNAVRAKEGDAYALGALPLGTEVHCIEKIPGQGPKLVHAAGTRAIIQRREDDKHVVVTLPSKRIVILHEECMATVGRLSNIIHGSTPIGSAAANRWLGNRPKSGLWQRKDGRFGRKIRRAPPPKKYLLKECFNVPYKLTLSRMQTSKL